MQKVTSLRPAPHIQPLVPINTFGAFLRYLREREQIPQHEFVSTFSYFFEEYHLAPLTQDMYRKLENGKRAPQYEELLPLYAALVGNDFKLTPQERNTFVRLARLKLEGLQRKKPKLRTDGEWRLLEIQLSQIDQDTKLIQEIEKGIEAPEKRTQRKSSLDISHIVGREDWLTRMLSYLDAMPKKLVVVQGMMGIGKTSSLKLLLHHLLDREECWPILYSFSTAADVTPADHLDTFLATIHAELRATNPETGKTPSVARRIQQVIELLAATQQRVILLLDDAQVIMDEHGQLSRDWQHFFTEYLRSNHQALVYLATREWSLWTGRERSFVVDGDDAILPRLDSQAGIHMWQRLGFTDVPEKLLGDATDRCGGNALMIELRAANLQRPRFSFGWQRTKIAQEKKSEHQRLIEQLLTDTHIFGSADVEARQLLQQVIGTRLSHDALQLLEVLAVAPMALPFPLLLEINQQAEYAFAELIQASLIDRNAMEHHKRAALQPLAREAAIHQLLANKRLDKAEQVLVYPYTIWLEQGTFHSEQEQAMLVSELAATHLKHHHLLKAAELLVEYGWLSFAFGHAPRLARIADDVMRSFNWHRLVEEEVGGLLIQYHLLARALDKDLGNAERKRAYLHLYDVMISEVIVFKPPTIAHLVHHRLRYLTSAKQYAEAWALIDEICKKYEGFQSSHPTTYTELLDRRAYILGRWGDHLDALAKEESNTPAAKKLQEESFRLRQDAALGHQQCVSLLQQNERFASPIEQSHMQFKRARLLNDLSYYQRVTGNLEAAKQAMKECLKLKEAGFVVPSSLAVSYDDYGQLLGQLGQYQEALTYSYQALEIMQKLIDIGQNAASKEKGMLLINRGKLLMLLGKLDEAKALFSEGILLVKGTSRDDTAASALESLRVIDLWEKTNPRHQLDWRWYPRYHLLSSYSDVKWLTPAGPFSEEEKLEWDSLTQQGDTDASQRMSTIITQSRRRELARCLIEQREPCFHYPLIPYEEVQSRLSDLTLLRAEIEQHEANVIVRRLYAATIDERLNELNLIAASGHQDDDAFWVYNQRLNSVPSRAEMELAIRQLTDTLQRGLQRDDTEELSKHLLQQTSQWIIKPMSLNTLDTVSEQRTKGQQASTDETQKLFSPETVSRFFADVFQAYQFPWTIKLDSLAGHARVNLNLHQLTLPGDGKWMSLAKIRELLGHEIETHAFRSNAGEKSLLAILSTGLQGFLETEEGLAIYYTQEVDQRASNYKPNKSWIGTLATGLASGIICEPFTFRKLLLFLKDINTLRILLAEKGLSLPEIQEEALQSAQNRCLRTWRGVTHLSRPGICSTKDNVYLRGYLSIVKALTEEGIAFERMMIGSVGLHHLGDLAELGITKPTIIHQRLATDPSLEKYISRFAD